MANSTQAGRPLAISTSLGDDALLLVKLRGREAVSELFHFDLELLAEPDTEVAFEKLVRQPAKVTVHGPGGFVRRLHGIISQFTQADRDDDFVHYQARLAPRFWLWTRRVQSRIFQQQTVPEVLRAVLSGLNVVFELHADYPTRDYCVQYQESDFAFASRLMEEEGIAYFFRHSAEDHQLVLTDRSLHHPEIAAPATIVYDRRREAPESTPRVRRFAKTQSVGIDQYTVREYHFQLSKQTLEATQKPAEPLTLGRARHVFGGADNLEVFEYPAGYAPHYTGIDPNGQDQPEGLKGLVPHGAHTARLRMEAETASCLTIQGEGNVASFLPGHVFRLERHPDGDHPYLLLGVEHEVTLEGDYRSGQGQSLAYRNRFEGQPAALAYRPPRRTPRPVILGPQTAVVVGVPDSTQPLLDCYGRVKVLFHWDRAGQRDSKSSCWVRVSQVWAGQGWGAFFWPRPGHEVIVAFEGGDPDRPLVVGSVYNEVNRPPYNPQVVPEAAGFKSCSFDGNPLTDYNALVFEDLLGREQLHLYSKKSEVVTSEGARFRHSPAPCFEYFGAPAMRSPGSGAGAGEFGDFVFKGLLDISPLARFIHAFVDIERWRPLNEQFFRKRVMELFGGAAMIPMKNSHVVGHSLVTVFMGQRTTEIVGGMDVRYVINPFAILGSLIEKLPLKLLAAGLAGLPLYGVLSGDPLAALLGLYDLEGDVSMVCGARTAQTYWGPKFEVLRGRELKVNGRIWGAGADAAANPAHGWWGAAAQSMVLVLSLYKLAVNAVNAVIGVPEKEADVSLLQDVTRFVLNGRTANLLHKVLLSLEWKCYSLQEAKEKAEDTVNIIKDVVIDKLVENVVDKKTAHEIKANNEVKAKNARENILDVPEWIRDAVLGGN